MTYDVYICYNRRDNEIASSVATYLNRQQLKCFVDLDANDITGSYFNTTQKAIKESEFFIYIYGTGSENSMWQRRELDLALSLGKHVISLLSCNITAGVIFNILSNRTKCISLKYPPLITPEELNEITHILTKDSNKRYTAPTNESNIWRRSHRKQWKKITFIALVLAALFSMALIPSLFVRRTAPPGYIPEPPRKPGVFYGSPYDYPYSNIESHPVQTASRFTEVLNYNRILFFSIGIVCGLLLTWLIKQFFKKNILLYCDVNAAIFINNVFKTKINAGETYRIRLKKGVYGIDFRADNNQQGAKRIVKTITDNSTQLIYCDFLKTKEINFKCFIAGSIKLEKERDALRAKCAELYNRWDNFAIRVSSYTYQDFSRYIVAGGPQKMYDKFISEEANWAIFILQDGIGEKTLEEYNVALESYFRNGHPKILILSYTNSAMDPVVMKIKNEIINHNQYWNTCKNIEEMKSLFYDCLQWDLILINENRKANKL